jgi:hypothetical protein
VPGRSPIAVMRNPLAPARAQGVGAGGEARDAQAGNQMAAPARPPPEGSPSTSARHSRMATQAPKWAGGAPMPPSQSQMARMAQRA